jgi:TonB family protein
MFTRITLKPYTLALLPVLFFWHTAVVCAQTAKPRTGNHIYAVADQPPVFPGGEQALDTYFSKALADVPRMQEGVITLSLVVDKSGQVADAVITSSFSSRENMDAAANLALDQAIVKAALKMPRWEPGMMAKQAVDTRVLLPLKIKRTGSELPAEERAYMYVEQMPSFPGGSKAMEAYIVSEMKYPAEALNREQEGQVLIQLTVSKTGELTNISLLKSNYESLGIEALRIVKAMPAWAPGKQNGRAVPVQMVIPIIFKLPHE